MCGRSDELIFHPKSNSWECHHTHPLDGQKKPTIDWAAPGPHTPRAAAAAIAMFDAIEVEPQLKLKLLAGCAERIRHRASKVVPSRPARVLLPEFKAAMAKGPGKGTIQADLDDVRGDR